MSVPGLYDEDWRVINEVPTIDDREHRIMRGLGLTGAGCNCHHCCHLRDTAIVAMQPFGDEDDRALKAMDRMLSRSSSQAKRDVRPIPKGGKS